MVQDTFGYTMSTVEGVTGGYFDGAGEARAHRQAYNPQARARLWGLSEQLCGWLLDPLVSR